MARRLARRQGQDRGRGRGGGSEGWRAGGLRLGVTGSRWWNRGDAVASGGVVGRCAKGVPALHARHGCCGDLRGLCLAAGHVAMRLNRRGLAQEARTRSRGQGAHPCVSFWVTPNGVPCVFVLAAWRPGLVPASGGVSPDAAWHVRQLFGWFLHWPVLQFGWQLTLQRYTSSRRVARGSSIGTPLSASTKPMHVSTQASVQQSRAVPSRRRNTHAQHAMLHRHDRHRALLQPALPQPGQQLSM